MEKPEPTLVTQRASMSAGKLPPSAMAIAPAMRETLASTSVPR